MDGRLEADRSASAASRGRPRGLERDAEDVDAFLRVSFRPMDLSEYAARNREIWNADAPQWVESGREAWASPTPWWGMWDVPEEEVNILPDVSGPRRGRPRLRHGLLVRLVQRSSARAPVGLDLSEEQLATARSSRRSTGSSSR